MWYFKLQETCKKHTLEPEILKIWYLSLLCGFFYMHKLVEGTTQFKNHGMCHEGDDNSKDEDY